MIRPYESLQERYCIHEREDGAVILHRWDELNSNGRAIIISDAALGAVATQLWQMAIRRIFAKIGKELERGLRAARPQPEKEVEDARADQ